MASYNDSLIDLVRKVTEARQIEYWVDQGGTVTSERSNIASVVGVSPDKIDDLLDMVSVLEDDPHYALEELSSSSAVQGPKGKEYPSRTVYRFSAV